jgi:hypothetical protein
VGADTVAWLAQQAPHLAAAPSLAVVHIPVPEFMAAWSAGAANGSRTEHVSCPSEARTNATREAEALEPVRRALRSAH